MNKQQLDYTFNRIQTICNQKLHQFKNNLPSPPEYLELAQKYAEIKSGKAKLRPLSEMNYGTRFTEGYEYSKDKKRKQIEDSNREKTKEFEQKLNAAAQTLKDRIVYLEITDVQAALRKFEEQKI